MDRIAARVFLTLLASAAMAAGDSVKIESRDGRLIEVTVLAVEEESVRVRKADGKEFAIPLSNLSEESVKRIKGMAEPDAPAEGGLPVVKDHTEDLTAGEIKCFEDLHPVLREYRDEVMFKPDEPKTLALKAELDAIMGRLDAIHGGLSAQERCERLMAVMRQEMRGGTVSASIGAGSCLAQMKGPEATASLFKVIEADLWEATETECIHGLGERCTGEVMDKVLEWFMHPDPKFKARGGYALTKIKTKAQLEELKGKAATVVNTEEAKDRLRAVLTFTRNVR